MLTTTAAILHDIAREVAFEAYRRMPAPQRYSSRMLEALEQQGMVILTTKDVCLTAAGVKRARRQGQMTRPSICEDQSVQKRQRRALRTFGRTLRMWRDASGLTQRQAAVASGIGERSISSFETGERVTSMKLLPFLILLDLYGVPFEDAFAVLRELLDAHAD